MTLYEGPVRMAAEVAMERARAALERVWELAVDGRDDEVPAAVADLLALCRAARAVPGSLDGLGQRPQGALDVELVNEAQQLHVLGKQRHA